MSTSFLRDLERFATTLEAETPEQVRARLDAVDAEYLRRVDDNALAIFGFASTIDPCYSTVDIGEFSNSVRIEYRVQARREDDLTLASSPPEFPESEPLETAADERQLLFLAYYERTKYTSSYSA